MLYSIQIDFSIYTIKEGKEKMNVFIINQEFNHLKTYQIMIGDQFGFRHVFPGQLFTLEQAKTICKENNFNIIKIGTIYQCI